MTSVSGTVAEAQKFVDSYLALPTRIPITKPLAKPAPTGKNIVYMQCGVPVCVKIGEGMSEAVKALGWNLTKLDMGTTPDKIVSAWTEAVRLKPDGVISFGVPRVVFSKQLAELKAAGVPVVTGSVDETEGDGVIAVLAGTPYFADTGEWLARWVVADSKGKADIVYFYVPDFPALAVQQKAFVAELGRLCPDCEQESIAVSATDIGKGLPGRVVSAVQSNADANYAVFAFADMTLGVPQALRGVSLHQKVKIVSNGGGGTRNLQAVKAGDETMNIPSDVVASGWEALDPLVRHFNGEALPREEYNQVPVVFMTASNVVIPIGDDNRLVQDYENQYSRLWQVGR